MHPGRRAGQPVAQLPLPVALAAAPAARLHGQATADLGQCLVGQLHHMEVIDHQRGVRQRGTDRGLEDGAHVDRDEAHPLAPGRITLSEPAGHGGDGAALDLTEQPLIAGQVHEPGVRRSTAVIQVPVASSSTQRGRPQRTSSMPSTATGAGWAGNTRRACSVNATGHDRP